MWPLLLTIITILSLGPYIACYYALDIYATWFRSKKNGQRTQLARKIGVSAQTKIVGFFHPYCNAGGGGERVLWAAIVHIQKTRPDVLCVVYSGDKEASKEEIIAKVKSRFDIVLDPRLLHFVFLNSRHLVEDSTWPRFTLLGQSLGSMYLVYEAMTKLIPDLYIDTMGYGFTFPAVRFLTGVRVGAYVHYPTISTSMLKRVESRQQGVTNSDWISSSFILSQIKLLYYRIFMYHYSLSLRTASFLMVNSTWTKNHIDSILTHSDPILDLYHLFPPLILLRFLVFKLTPSQNRQSQLATQIVYPPCPTAEMSQFPLDDRQRVLLSIAQFRPEKDHQAQLLAFAELLRQHPEYTAPSLHPVKLVLIGGCRNEQDARRVEALKEKAKQLGIESQTTFILNASYREVLEWLSKASIGLSTMVDEHFGINIVELMAAGVIPVTHASGGPLQDIVVPYHGGATGFHATDPVSFAAAIHGALSLSPLEDQSIRKRARESANDRFSEECFVRSWDAGLGTDGLDHWW